MIDSLMNLLFRCSHRRLTRPVTPVHKPGTPRMEAYVVCLDCGKHFTYDVIQMRMGKEVKRSASAQLPEWDTPQR
jgi:DNA-directed RNA polymerase subunit RPC12/RpoP